MLLSTGRVLGEFPPRPTDWVGDLTVVGSARNPVYVCDFCRASQMFSVSIAFTGAVATRWRSEPMSRVEDIRAAYCKWVVVSDSMWLAELSETDGRHAPYAPKLSHFLLYLEDSGTFEVAADSAIVLPEERAHH